MKKWSDVDPEEERFLAEFQRSLDALRAYGERCPEPDVLMAAAGAGILPNEAADGMAAHLSECRLCRMLARDLAAAEISGPARKEMERIGARVLGRQQASSARANGIRLHWIGRAVPVLTVLVLAVGTVLWIYVGRQSPPAHVSSTGPAGPWFVLPLEKPPVKLPPATALVWRGEAQAGHEKYLADLGQALSSYRGDDYAEASRRFEALVGKYPTAEVHFYLGICRLFVQANEGAISALLSARQVATGPLAQDATWYLSVAYERAGQRESAQAELQKLCREEGQRRATACGALEQLKTARR